MILGLEYTNDNSCNVIGQYQVTISQSDLLSFSSDFLSRAQKHIENLQLFTREHHGWRRVVSYRGAALATNSHPGGARYRYKFVL